MVLGLALVLMIVAAFVQPCKRSPDARSPITMFHGDVHVPIGAFWCVLFDPWHICSNLLVSIASEMQQLGQAEATWGRDAERFFNCAKNGIRSFLTECVVVVLHF